MPSKLATLASIAVWIVTFATSAAASRSSLRVIDASIAALRSLASSNEVCAVVNAVCAFALSVTAAVAAVAASSRACSAAAYSGEVTSTIASSAA